ncbi:hypothetical protein EVAR_88032_1 [Eumeta japonica]|uniref:BED-type domain-containing protein n=1 Tax=Eumeta variegata TaxID=151549 RepID=A0A4C1VDT1_EUMVA|nr:hypothetical protein EVAR_88032_1 [Eumeta japonica]
MSPRHKSKLWEHFTRTGNGKVKCSHCCREMSVKNKSTCSLIRHMIRLHPSINITKADGTTFVSQDSGPKETKQRSSTWEHFTHALEDRVKCKYCEKELSIKNESACSLIRHLLKKHPSVEIHRRTRYSISSSDLESFDEEDDYDDIGGDNVDVGDDNDGSHIGVDDYNEGFSRATLAELSTTHIRSIDLFRQSTLIHPYQTAKPAQHTFFSSSL